MIFMNPIRRINKSNHGCLIIESEFIFGVDSSIDEEFASHTAGFVAVVNNEDNENRFKTALFKVNSIEELIKEK